MPMGTDLRDKEESSRAQSQPWTPIPREASSSPSSKTNATGPLGGLATSSSVWRLETRNSGVTAGGVKENEREAAWVTQLSPAFKSQTYRAVPKTGGSSPVSLLTPAQNFPGNTLGDTPTALSFFSKPLSPVTMTLNTNCHSCSEKWSGGSVAVTREQTLV